MIKDIIYRCTVKNSLGFLRYLSQCMRYISTHTRTGIFETCYKIIECWQKLASSLTLSRACSMASASLPEQSCTALSLRSNTESTSGRRTSIASPIF